MSIPNFSFYQTDETWHALSIPDVLQNQITSRSVEFVSVFLYALPSPGLALPPVSQHKMRVLRTHSLAFCLCSACSPEMTSSTVLVSTAPQMPTTAKFVPAVQMFFWAQEKCVYLHMEYEHLYLSQALKGNMPQSGFTVSPFTFHTPSVSFPSCNKWYHPLFTVAKR